MKKQIAFLLIFCILFPVSAQEPGTDAETPSHIITATGIFDSVDMQSQGISGVKNDYVPKIRITVREKAPNLQGPSVSYTVNLPSPSKDWAYIAQKDGFPMQGDFIQIYKDNQNDAPLFTAELGIQTDAQGWLIEIPDNIFASSKETLFFGVENESGKTAALQRTAVNIDAEPKISANVPQSISISNSARKLSVSVQPDSFSVEDISLFSSNNSVLGAYSDLCSIKGIAKGAATLTIQVTAVEKNTQKTLTLEESYPVEATGSNSGGGGGGGGGGSSVPKPSATPTAAPTATPTAAPTETPLPSANPFDDIPPDLSWAEESIVFLADKGIVTGTGDRTFSPNDHIIRGDFVLLLSRMFDLTPSSDAESPFQDVTPSDYYYDAVLAAKELDIVSGMTESTFAPGQSITREDMAAIFYRTLVHAKAIDPEADLSVLKSYRDNALISDYTRKPLAAMTENGLIKGKEYGIAPKDTATRAEMAVILKRVYDLIHSQNF